MKAAVKTGGVGVHGQAESVHSCVPLCETYVV